MIKEFQGDYRFLSNFWMVPVDVDGVTYPSAEHAYQASKTDSRQHKMQIKACKTPGQAKRLGKTVPLRTGATLPQVKLDAMRRIVLAKFQQNAFIRRALLDTHPQQLQEGNTWGDRFWGICRGEGENNLGKILVEVREQLRQEQIKQSGLIAQANFEQDHEND